MSLQRAKTIISNPLNKRDIYSQDLVQSIDDIKNNYISIENILLFKSKKDYLSPQKYSPQDCLLIIIDTETTGLQQTDKFESYVDKKGIKNDYISYRNQIVEIGAVSYNWNLNFESNSDKTFFHGKIKDISLNEFNSIYKIESALISKFNDLYLSNKDKITNAFSIAQGKAKYNPDYNIFINNFPPIFDDLDEFNKQTLIRHIFKYNLLIAINEMNQSSKRTYKYLYNQDKTYNVNDNYQDELNLIESLFDFIESKINMYSNVIIGAHNFPYDEGMIRGAITTAIDYHTYIEEDTSMKEHYKNLLKRHNNIFQNNINTIDIFKDIINHKKYGNRLINLYNQKPDYKKIKLLKHLTKSLNNKKYSSGSFSVALGNLAPYSLNQDFHTTINDINVTIETLKLYFSIPMIIDYYHKIKISEQIKMLIEKI
jgi:DNA polymerase III epsilon subunit-like protein